MLKFLFLLLLPFSTKAQTVFKTPSGEKYHLANCRMVKNVSEEITTAKAMELGLEPCKICKPANIYGSAPIVHKAQGLSTTAQCKGMTRAW